MAGTDLQRADGSILRQFARLPEQPHERRQCEPLLEHRIGHEVSKWI